MGEEKRVVVVEVGWKKGGYYTVILPLCYRLYSIYYIYIYPTYRKSLLNSQYHGKY